VTAAPAVRTHVYVTLRWNRFSDRTLVTTTAHTLLTGGAIVIDQRTFGGDDAAFIYEGLVG